MTSQQGQQQDVLDVIETVTEPERARRDRAETPRAGLYITTLAVLVVVLAAMFLAAYDLLAMHPEHAPGVAWQVYGALLVGLATLCVQALFVTVQLLRPLRENALEATRLRVAMDNVSHHDPLTGVLNRVAFDQVLVRVLEALKRYDSGFVGIFVDVDDFRAINDALGYAAGDQVLHELARLLRTHLRKSDSLYRWRSGAFVILAPGIELEQGALLAEKLRELVASSDYPGGVRVHVTLGVSQARGEDNQDSFIGRLKAAVAQGKERGGDVVERA
jgi:diguanylate cyclase (GGDEF)-like protein